jgi:hypothetical protein
MNYYVEAMGGSGKFFEFGANIGICVPLKCDEEDIRPILEPVFKHLGEVNGIT